MKIQFYTAPKCSCEKDIPSDGFLIVESKIYLSPKEHIFQIKNTLSDNGE